MQLETLEVSSAYLEAAERHPGLEITGPPRIMAFDAGGKLKPL
jgi:hypothetical protein